MPESDPEKPLSIVALIASSEEDRHFFKRRLSSFSGLACQFFSSIRQFKSQCPGTRYSCLMIEIKTLFKSTPSEKRFFNFLLDQFSVMRVRVNSDKSDFSGFVENMELTGLSGDQVLDLFLRDLCGRQAPRGIRMEGRTSVHLSVYLDFTDTTGQARRIKATTLDVSEGGCFIVTPP